ncbi:MAG: hypothetical protein ABI411_01520 [Tahibacter sp.]
MRSIVYLAAGMIAASGVFTTAASAAGSPQIIPAIRHDTSRPMRDIVAEMGPSVTPEGGEEYIIPNRFLKESGADMSLFLRELAARNVQNVPMGIPAPSTIVSFTGLTRALGGGGTPPDTNGDVSPTHYIEWINTSWAIFNKTTGALISGPTAGNSFFAGFGGACQTSNSGDPIALWDDRAQRWVMSQFTTGSPASQCFAVSTTSDPLGTYNRYEFQWPTSPAPVFGDYPHIGIWTDASGTQDAYTLVTHEFNNSTQAFLGAAFTAVERDKMLAGLPAQMVRFPGFDAYGAEPIHLDGPLNARARSCPTYVHYDASTSEYLFWDLCVNWTTPASSTISALPQRIAAKTPFVPYFGPTPQLGSVNPLDSFGTHIMYRAVARAFPASAPTALTMVVNQTVIGGPANQGAIRWTQFGLSQPGESFDRIFPDGFDVNQVPVALVKKIVDEGTYAPDNNSRFMGGIAIDGGGNIGVGYNVSSATINPKLRINGRTLSDPAGQLRDEQDCAPAVTGSQTGSFGGRGRWGDYASMSVDPADECTFWLAGEFYPVTSTGSYATRICSFKFPNCGSPDWKLVVESAQRIQVCGSTPGPDPAYTLFAGTIGGFNSPAVLAVTGTPPATSQSFSVNPISPTPGNSVLTIVGGHGAASGEYLMTVTGVANSLVRTATVELGVSATATGAPTLTAPANAATGIKVRPHLTWNAVPGALTYIVEVSTSNTFATLAASATVTGTSWDVDPTLASTTAYFWRVRPTNYCGNGATSAVFTFTTGTPGTCPTGTAISVVASYSFDTGAPETAWTVGAPGDAGSTPWANAAPLAGATGFTNQTWNVADGTVTSDRSILSPSIAVPVAAAVILEYDGYHSFETDDPGGCWDGATLELKAGAGSFAQLGNNRFFTDPYDGVFSAGAPRAGAQGWCHQAAGTAAKHSIVDLDDFNGQSVQLRFRSTSDGNTVATATPAGMVIDNVKVSVCQ